MQLDQLRKIYSPDNFWMKFIFLVSGTAVTALLSFALSVPKSPALSLLVLICGLPSLLVASWVWIYLLYRYDLLKKIWVQESKYICSLSFLCALITSGFFVYYYLQNIFSQIELATTYFLEFLTTETNSKYTLVSHIFSDYSSILVILFGIALGCIGFFALYLIWKYLFHVILPCLRRFYIQLGIIEKYYLYGIFFLSVIAVPLIYSLTTAFYLPIDFYGTFHSFDVFYCMDTGDLMQQNIYTNIGASSNSSHQYLFGLFSLPFGILAFIISKIFFFIPHSFYMAIAIIQIVILSVMGILLSRLLSLNKILQLLFLLTYTVSFGYLIYSLSLEQYVFVTFWVVLFVYSVINKTKFSEWSYIAAAGSLVSSSILFPLLSNGINIRKYFSVAFMIACLAIISGKLFSLSYLLPHLFSITQTWGASTPLADKLLQYLNFIPSSLIFDGGVDGLSFRNAPVTSINFVGICFLGVMLLGFFLNYKEQYARICFGWFFFSFILLGIMGFGTSGNELPLYSLYFSWAFLSLIYLAIKKLFAPYPNVQTAILLGLLVAMICINIPGIYEVIQFGIEYYPVR